MNETRPTHIRLLWLTMAICAVGVVGLYFFFDPQQVTIFPACQFHRLTGLDCPGCGGQRALHQLLHGNFAEAFRLNPLMFILLPLALWYAVREVLRVTTGKILPSLFVRPVWLWILVGCVVLFGIGRNLPFGPLAWFRQG